MSAVDRIWKTKNGREIHVERMTEVHIWNTMAMLQRQIDDWDVIGAHTCMVTDISDGPCPDCRGAESGLEESYVWLEVFRVELLRRGLSGEILWDKLERANRVYEEGEKP